MSDFNIDEGRRHGDISGVPFGAFKERESRKAWKAKLLRFCKSDEEIAIVDTLFDRLSAVMDRSKNIPTPEQVLMQKSDSRSEQLMLRNNNVRARFDVIMALHEQKRPRQLFNRTVEETPGWNEWLAEKDAMKLAQTKFWNQIDEIDCYTEYSDDDLREFCKQENVNFSMLYSIDDVHGTGDLTWKATFDNAWNKILSEVMPERPKVQQEEYIKVPIPTPDIYLGQPESPIQAPTGKWAEFRDELELADKMAQEQK